MKVFSLRRFAAFYAIITVTQAAAADPLPAITRDSGTVHVLFLGNSFTGRHNLSELVKAMIEAGNPNVKFEVTTVIYGGRTMADHWRLHSQNFINFEKLTIEQEKATLASLDKMIAADPNDRYATAAKQRHEGLLKLLAGPRHKWDIVVLQSYRDDTIGAESKYVEYVPRMAELVKAQGGRTVLYETTPDTQNEKPLTSPPDAAPVQKKEAVIAELAKRVDAIAVPMAQVAFHCQRIRPDLTLRYVNDGHLNKTMAYLTACTFYAALCDRSAEGVVVDTVTDTRSLDDKRRDLDRDGKPITQKFSPKDCADLQKIAWDGLKQFKALGTRSKPR